MAKKKTVKMCGKEPDNKIICDLKEVISFCTTSQ